MKRICFLVLCFVAAGCGKEQGETATPLRPVYTTTVRTPSASVERTFSGQVQSSESSSVSFNVGGRLIEVAAVAGQRYTSGAVLARIDPTDATTALSETEARFTEAQSTMRRTQSLFENGNASQSQFESAMAGAQAARAAYDAAKKRVADCTLTMPYDGVIGRVNVSQQEMVTAGQGVMSLLADSDSLEFEVGIPAEWIRQVSIGLPGRLNISALKGKTFEATISKVGGEQDSNTTYPVTFTFATGHADIREGMDGEIVMQLSNPSGETMTVPISCVAALPGNVSYVYKIQPQGTQGSLERQEVTTGQIRQGGRIEVLDGLAEGDRLVSRGVHKLSPGMTVLLSNDLETE
jgi:RND family efflux transporter MFP subunit